MGLIHEEWDGKKDRERVHKLLNQFDRTQLKMGRPVTTPTRRTLAKYLARGGKLLTARKGKDLVGLSMLMPSDRVTGLTHLSTLIVDKKARGNGYGRNLLNKSIQYAKKNMKARHIGLSSLARNDAANSLYADAGFSPVSQFMMKDI